MLTDSPTDSPAPSPAESPHVDDAIVIGRRSFRLATRFTLSNDLYIAREYAAAGLADAFQAFGSTPSLDVARGGLVFTAFSSGRLFALLAGLLHEDGVKWTEDSAKTAAVFFADVVDRRSKLALLEAAAVGIAATFLNSLPPSPAVTAAGA